MNKLWLALVPGLVLTVALAGCNPDKLPNVTPTPTPAAVVSPSPTVMPSPIVPTANPSLSPPPTT